MSYVAIFPAISFTFITIPAVFSVYVLFVSACQVAPPLKLYASACNPLSVSVAVIVNFTAPFVQSNGSCATLIVGAVVSWIWILAYFV